METRRRISIILMVGLLIVVSDTANGETNDDGPGVLQRIIYANGDAHHELTLWWQILFTREELRTFFDKSHIHAKDFPFHHLIFVLTDSPVGHEEKGRIVWVGYESILESRSQWTAQLAWRPSEDHVFVTLLQDRGLPGIHMKVYDADLRNTIDGHIPLDLALSSFGAWPKPAEPLAQLTAHLGSLVPGDYLCSISWFKTVPVRDRLLIYGERKGKECNPVYLVLDLKTKLFSIGILEEKALKQSLQN